MKKTEQENFWQGEFGDEYIDRNQSDILLASNIYFFSKIFTRIGKLDSIIEFGCNTRQYKYIYLKNYKVEYKHHPTF